ncbi:hypothetical protein FA13DRAFT_82020 [Coprinellus micaceus]|uniref:F1F0 ATP synthase assembly protein Atp10 n=1 Tax=Coprinellus micaceus TaxID=71717 RepID=A0A4Y7TK80_COPMI|nr:hypothetical protein FA13DRAFT_82020 [Coprinellus micaceus]
MLATRLLPRRQIVQSTTRAIHVSQVAWKDQKPKGTKPPKASNSKPNPPTRDQPLGPLTRPLGVRERPTTIVKTRMQRMKELLDSDVRTAQRRHLIKEAAKGYFHDMNMTRTHGGKTWIAPNVLIREDKSLYLPNIAGTALSDKATKNTTEMCYGKVTVLSMLSTKISEIHSQALIEPTYSHFASSPHFQYLQVNLQENVLKAFLVNLFVRQLREAVPRELHDTYLISTQNMEYIREPLGMTNSQVGYVYLVDENLRIRWAACAEPTQEEIQALESCTGVLLNRPGTQVRISEDYPRGKTDDGTHSLSHCPPFG